MASIIVLIVSALYVAIHAAVIGVDKDVSLRKVIPQIGERRNLGQLSTEHLSMNSKLDQILEKLDGKGTEDSLSVLEAINQLEMSVANIQTKVSLMEESNSDTNTKMIKNRQDIDILKQKETQLKTSFGTTYTRWGRTQCPGNGSDLVYQGYAGGSYYEHTGAASSMLCLPIKPEYGQYDDNKANYGGYVYGTEYRDSHRDDKLFLTGNYKQDVPCAVCIVNSRAASIMIPAKTSCYPGWTVEYRGYLMSGSHDHKAATDYYCIDTSPENVYGGSPDQLGRLLYFVESRCGSLQCPPYVDGRELACVVCTK